MAESLVYKNIYFYRLLMNLIYLGKYKRRFDRINNRINSNTGQVIELCFGDTYIARYCRKNNIQWKGYDLNENFVAHAKKLGYNAYKDDITKFDEFEKCDTYIMIGSLYHFKDAGIELLRKMIKASKQVIVSEPIKNLSSTKGIIGFIAKRSANAGKGQETFRYNETSFIKLMDELNIEYKILSKDKDILIEIINERN